MHTAEGCRCPLGQAEKKANLISTLDGEKPPAAQQPPRRMPEEADVQERGGREGRRVAENLG